MIQRILISRQRVQSNQQPPSYTEDKFTKRTQKSETTIDNLLLDLQPLIHFTALILRLVQWKYKDDAKHSLLLLLFWIMLRSLHDFILYISPIIFLFVVVTLSHGHPSTKTSLYQHHCDKKKDKSKRESLKEDLTEIYNVFYFFISVKDFVRESDTLCFLHHKHFSMATVKQRSTIYFGVACLFTLTYVKWVTLVEQQTVNSCAAILWFFILLIMCLRSPWVNPLLDAIFRIFLPFIYHSNSFRNNNGFSIITSGDITFGDIISQRRQSKKDINSTTIKTYCFEIVHHQRWWFPAGWSNLLLPQDRPVWSDIHLESTPSIHDFKLPPKTTYFVETNKQKIVSWTWIDPSWSKKQKKDNNSSHDKDGWEYSSWKWKSWSSQSSGLGICTRRQKWIRYAQRQETLVQLESNTHDRKTVPNDCPSLIGQSDTPISPTYSSIYYWDDTTSTNSTAYSNHDIIMEYSPSPTQILPSTPTLISNVVSSTLHRSLHFTSFNIPITLYSRNIYQNSAIHVVEEDSIHRKYCCSSKSNNPKRHSII